MREGGYGSGKFLREAGGVLRVGGMHAVHDFFLVKGDSNLGGLPMRSAYWKGVHSNGGHSRLGVACILCVRVDPGLKLGA